MLGRGRPPSEFEQPSRRHSPVCCGSVGAWVRVPPGGCLWLLWFRRGVGPNPPWPLSLAVVPSGRGSESPPAACYVSPGRGSESPLATAVVPPGRGSESPLAACCVSPGRGCEYPPGGCLWFLCRWGVGPDPPGGGEGVWAVVLAVRGVGPRSSLKAAAVYSSPLLRVLSSEMLLGIRGENMVLLTVVLPHAFGAGLFPPRRAVDLSAGRRCVPKRCL